MKIAIVGITGLVGKKLLDLLEIRNYPITKFIPIASVKSKNQICKLYDREYIIHTIDILLEEKLDIIFFTSTNDISKQWIPKLINNSKYIIDNSSHYRLLPSIPLIIPEINGHLISNLSTNIIANPNWSTAQLVMVLYPLHLKYNIKRIIVSTYQSVSVSGQLGINQLFTERQIYNQKTNNYQLLDKPYNMVYQTNIDLNCIPYCDEIDYDTGYTKEELKLIQETKKILDPSIDITATSVRVPTIGGDGETVNIEFEQEFQLGDIIQLFNHTNGIEIKTLATPADIKDNPNIWVSRIRRDYSRKNSLNLWIVADNLIRGRALNAIQIAELITTR